VALRETSRAPASVRALVFGRKEPRSGKDETGALRKEAYPDTVVAARLKAAVTGDKEVRRAAAKAVATRGGAAHPLARTAVARRAWGSKNVPRGRRIPKEEVWC